MEVAEVGSCWMLEVVGIATRCCACHRRLEAADSVATLLLQRMLDLSWIEAVKQTKCGVRTKLTEGLSRWGITSCVLVVER